MHILCYTVLVLPKRKRLALQINVNGGAVPSIDFYIRRAIAMSIETFLSILSLLVSVFSLGYMIGKDINRKKQK